MFEVLRTPQFGAWVAALRDETAQALVASRIDRLAAGSFGDVKSVGSGVMEARIHHGPGYRLYFTRRGRELILMLAGGDKSSQRRDIEAAIKIRSEIMGAEK
jgi:putative addiction module killer protein